MKSALYEGGTDPGKTQCGSQDSIYRNDAAGCIIAAVIAVGTVSLSTDFIRCPIDGASNSDSLYHASHSIAVSPWSQPSSSSVFLLVPVL